MQNNSLELSFLSLIALISFFVFLIIQKLSHKISNGALLDDDFNFFRVKKANGTDYTTAGDACQEFS